LKEVEPEDFDIKLDIIMLAEYHNGKEYAQEIATLVENSIATFWVHYEEGRLRCFVCYINSIKMEMDIVYVTDRYNTYTLDTYRLMKYLHKHTNKDIYSTVISNHTMMAKFAKVNKGYLIGDLLIFPKQHKEN